ncbi:MAG: type II toxin-antitoxin system HicA family toxin [Methanomicrobia archaeon]|nr:type II toxin-antitoxin system HicA family toxin [Methanomicrobia archaeon]
MKKLPVVSSDDVIKALKKEGFEYAPKRGKGSHTALFKIDEKGRKLLVIVPKRENCPKALFYPFFNKLIYRKMISLNS